MVVDTTRTQQTVKTAKASRLQSNIRRDMSRSSSTSPTRNRWQSLFYCFVRRARRVLNPGIARRDAQAKRLRRVIGSGLLFGLTAVFWGEITEPAGSRHAPSHQNVTARDEGTIRPHEECADGS